MKYTSWSFICVNTDHKEGISNCGVEIVKSDPPKEVMRIGYFGAWNGERPCLNMHADQSEQRELLFFERNANAA